MNSQTERLSLAGPAGAIEAARDGAAVGVAPRGVAVIAHPHPLFGGTMDNKVVQTLARAFVQCGWQAVRFNFRGVGATAFVVHPFRGTDTAKVETYRLPAALHKGTCQGLHHFVVHGAAKQRVRMGDHHHTTRCHTRGQLGGIHHGFDAAGGAGHHSLLGFGVHVLLPI